MRRPLLGLLACLLAGTVFDAAPASAQTGHEDKKAGDAPAAIDITGIDADNALRRVRIKLTVPGLGHEGTFTFSYEGPHYDGMAIVVREHGGGVTSQAWHCGEESCAKVKCRGIHVRWSVAEHYVSASVPQSCYPLPVPTAWNFNGHSDLGKAYDSDYTKLRLRRG
jgi:hypothetical protein